MHRILKCEGNVKFKLQTNNKHNFRIAKKMCEEINFRLNVRNLG